MPAPSPSDLIALVDADDEPVAVAPRAEAFSHRAGFRTVHAFLLGPRDELLLQRLAPERERNPGKWGSSVAAYLHAGESYGEAISRRVLEELGVEIALVDVGKTEMVDRGTRKFVTLYAGRIEGVPEILEPHHISELRFMPLEEVDARIAREPGRFTETFLHLWLTFRDRLRSTRAAM